MAIVKTLIVKGVARFLTDAYMSTIRSGIWNGSTIQVGYGGTGVTSGVGSASIPVFLSSTGLQPCTGNISSVILGNSATATTNITVNTSNPYLNFINGSSVAKSIRLLAGTGVAVTGATTANLITIAGVANALNTAGYVAAASGSHKYWKTDVNGNPSWSSTALDYMADWAAVSDVTVSSVEYHTFWKIAPTSSNKVYGVTIHPTNGLLYYVYNNNGTYSAGTYSANSNTWRNIYLAGTQILTTAISSKALNFKAGTNITLSYLAPGTTGGTTDSGDAAYGTLTIDAAEVNAVLSSANNGATHITAVTNSPYYNLLVNNSVKRTIQFKAGTCMTVSAATTGVITFSVVANAAGVAGYVAAPNATNDKNKVWMTNSSGVPAWRTAADLVGANVILLFSGAKTLTVSEWTTIAAVSSYTGTYAIFINSGNLYASGIFSACGGTDTIIDEIPLHVSSTSNTWRPYARISGANLEMASNEATGTSRTYTVKISKLI